MANIFSQDNPFNDLMSTIGDMAMISVAWTVFSIPIVTIGASTSAACEVARELQTGSSKGIFRSFWAAFKRRFPTNLALTAILALFWGLALFDLWYLSTQSGNTVAILYGVTLAVIAVIGSLFAFILPLSGRSKLSVGEQNQAIRQTRVNAPSYRICGAFAGHLADYRGIDSTAADVDAHPPIVDSRRGRSELLSADDARTQNIRPRIKNYDCRSKCAIAIFFNSSSHLIPLPERDRSKRGHVIRTALPSDAPRAHRRSA